MNSYIWSIEILINDIIVIDSVNGLYVKKGKIFGNAIRQ